MTDYWYNYGSPKYLLIRTGMPERNVQYGCGDTYAECVRDLSDTAIQSTGRAGGLFDAICWLMNEGTIDASDVAVEFDPANSVPRLGDEVEHDPSEEPEHVSFVLPPENAGQHIEVSYGSDGDYIYSRAVDRSNGSVSYCCYELPSASAADWASANKCDEAPEPSKDDVEDWEEPQWSYVSTFPAHDGEGACDVAVQVGEFDGHWFFRTLDDAGGDDDAPDTCFDSRAEAEAAAADFAADRDEADDGEDAEAYLRRTTEERAGEPSDEGAYCVYWDTALDGESRPERRYDTEEQAAAAVDLANADLKAANPGELLCAYEVRRLVDGEWVRVDG